MLPNSITKGAAGVGSQTRFNDNSCIAVGIGVADRIGDRAMWLNENVQWLDEAGVSDGNKAQYTEVPVSDLTDGMYGGICGNLGNANAPAGI